MQSLPTNNLIASKQLDSILEDINSALQDKFPELNPQITIYGDGSWSIDVDGWSVELGRHRICGAEQGEDMLSLVHFCRRSQF